MECACYFAGKVSAIGLTPPGSPLLLETSNTSIWPSFIRAPLNSRGSFSSRIEGSANERGQTGLRAPQLVRFPCRTGFELSFAICVGCSNERHGASRRCRRKRPAASAMPLTGYYFQQDWRRTELSFASLSQTTVVPSLRRRDGLPTERQTYSRNATVNVRAILSDKSIRRRVTSAAIRGTTLRRQIHSAPR